MIFFLALIPATMLTVAGYVAMFLSQRSEGSLKAFGKYLGFWAFTLAALLLLGSLMAASHCGRMHGLMMHGCGGEGCAAQCPYMAPWRHPPMDGGPAGLPGAPPAEPPSATAPAK